MDFQDELRTVCSQYAKKYGYPEAELARGFEAFVVHISAADGSFLSDPSAVADPMSADLGDSILRQADGGVDGYLEDESNKVVLLIQAKWSGGGGKVGADELKAFLDLPSVLASSERDAVLNALDARAKALLGTTSGPHERRLDGSPSFHDEQGEERSVGRDCGRAPGVLSGRRHEREVRTRHAGQS